MDRNVVLLCLDSVRKDYYDEYAPRLKGRAGTTFERAYAASGWSMPSHASMFTGDLPHEHGIHPSGLGTFAGLTPADTFLDGLPGYTTYGISANTYAGSGFGFDRLFDEFLDYSPSALFQDALKPQVLQNRTGLSGRERYVNFLRRSLTHDHRVKSLANGLWGVTPGKRRLSQSSLVPYSRYAGAEEMAAIAMDRLQTIEEPFFVFANFMDAHVPSEPTPELDGDLHSVPNGWNTDYLDPNVRSTPEPEGEFEDEVRWYRELYRSEIDYLDRVLARFVDELGERTNAETTFVIISDHGENLGYASDEYLVGHNSMSHAILHTPCSIVNPPDGFPDAVTELFSHLELGSLVERVAADLAFDADLVDDVAPAEVPRAGGLKRSSEPQAPRFERMVRCLLENDRKYLWDSLGNRELYRLSFGFPSKEQLVDDNASIPDRTAEFFPVGIDRYLAEVGGATVDEMELDPETRGQLEELGYL